MFSKKNIIKLLVLAIAILLILIIIVFITKNKEKNSNDNKNNDISEDEKILTNECLLKVDNIELSYTFMVNDDVIERIFIKEHYSFDNYYDYLGWIESYNKDNSYTLNDKEMEIYKEIIVSSFEERDLRSYAKYKDMLEKSGYECN